MFARLRCDGHGHGELIIGLLLAVFALRAFVPAGYMPSPGASLLEMCRAGFLASSPQAPAQDSDHAAGEHCLFAAQAAAPTAQFAQFASPPLAVSRVTAADPPLTQQSLRRAHQARGPPAFSQIQS